MNYGLKELLKEGKFENYRVFLLTNDTEFEKVPMIKSIRDLEEHNKVGILSPCSKRWGENFIGR